MEFQLKVQSITLDSTFCLATVVLPDSSSCIHYSLIWPRHDTPPTEMSQQYRALNIYTLPQELLSNLAVRTIAQLDDIPPAAEAGPSKPSNTSTKPNLNPNASPGSLSCQSCPNTAFESVDDQRAHFKSDWHRYNAKARIEAKKVVDAEQWDNMVEGEPSY